MPELTFRKDFAVHSYELDLEGRVRFVSLLNFLQDAAGDHAALLGWSVTDLLKRNMTWVLSRYHVRVDRFPAWGDRIRVTTWPSGRHGYFALRDFEASDGEGNAVLAGTSSWMVLDLGRKQPLKVDDILPTNFLLDRRALPDSFPSLPVLTEPEREVSFRVEVNHLDLNRHVNNAVYIQWALEAAPPEILTRRRPVEVEVSYRAEALFGDTIVSRLQAAPADGQALGVSPEPTVDAAQAGAMLAAPDAAPGGPAYIHQIVNAANGAELTRLKTRWK